jgi:hypothetical protein
MNRLIYAPMVTPADGIQQAQKRAQKEVACAWQPLKLEPALQTACSGDCDQGRRCNCALSSRSYCSGARAGDLASRHEQQGATRPLQMFQLLCGIVVLCSLAWFMS